MRGVRQRSMPLAVPGLALPPRISVIGSKETSAHRNNSTGSASYRLGTASLTAPQLAASRGLAVGVGGSTLATERVVPPPQPGIPPPRRTLRDRNFCAETNW